MNHLLIATISASAEQTDYLGPIIVVVVLFLIVAVIGIVIGKLITLPRVETIVRNGAIKVWPQAILRKKTTKAVIDHAQAVMTMNLPLAEGFYLAGLQTPGRSGVVLQAIASFLHQGLKLSEAYGRYKARNALVLSMMQVGERCGQLPGMLRHLQEHYDRETKQRREWEPVWWPYLILLLTVYFSIMFFLMVVVVPKFQTIFKDFGIALPKVTQAVIHVANWIAIHGDVWLGLAVLAAIIAFLRLQPRRYPQPRLYSRIADRLIWIIPGWREKYIYTDLAHAASVLRLALGSGMTMPEAVKCVTDLDLNTILRRRFVEFEKRLGRGEPLDEAGQHVRLPNRFLWALRDGQDPETLAASLGLIERYYSLVASHWFLAVNSLIWPVIVVMMGILVGTFNLAMFLPLVRLIEVNAGW